MARGPRKTRPLSNDDVRTIRREYGTPCPHCGYPVDGKMLAVRFNTSIVTIHEIRRRRVYKDVPDVAPEVGS